ncbi:hypothetical protein EW145_g3513 [Phellinidium pouzarii]|uniref:Uncharacterized protein n=1 Tax=Phellinidium pouzarii TaxID=167371 RepID=A0A4S4L738_9AGAM|nr:hypothetical protein EW145_g3513 [Phellinidium pouzarii]
MFNSASLLSQILTVLYLTPVHPPGAALQARLTALKVADSLGLNIWLSGQHSDERSPFRNYAECYIDDQTTGTVSTAVPLAHDPRTQCPLSSLTKHDILCYEPLTPEFVPFVHDPSSQCPLSSLTKHVPVCYEPPAPEVVPLVHDPRSQSPISSLTKSDTLCYDPPDPDDVPLSFHNICLSTDRTDDEMEMCSASPDFYDIPANGSSNASGLLSGLETSRFEMPDLGERYSLFTETADIKEAGGISRFLPTCDPFVIGFIMLVIAYAAFFSASGSEFAFALSFLPSLDLYSLFVFASIFFPDIFSSINIDFNYFQVCLLDCAVLAHHELSYYVASDTDDPSADAGHDDIDDRGQTLLGVIRSGQLALCVFEPSIANSSVPPTESDSSGVSTFSTTTFDVSYFDGNRRIIATVVLGSANESNVFELLGIFMKSETAYDSADSTRDSEFETESDMDIDDSSARSQRDAHDDTSSASMLISKKDNLSSSLNVTRLIEACSMDHISTAAAIGETQMDWNPSGGFMTYYMAALETEALKYHPLVIRRRRKVQRGSRGKHGKGKKDKNVAVCSLATPAEPEANIASVTAADSSFGEEVTGSVSASRSIYERPLANSSIPSLVSDTSSTASTVSLITLDSSYSGSVETAAVSHLSCFISEHRTDFLLSELQPDVYDGTSTTESHTLVPATKEDRPSLTQKITEFVQGYRTAQSTNDDTLEEISEVSRHHKKTRRGTRHRGKGGKGKKVVTRPAEVSSEPATFSSAGDSSSTGIAGSAPVVRPRLGSILAKTFSSVRSSAGRHRHSSG